MLDDFAVECSLLGLGFAGRRVVRTEIEAAVHRGELFDNGLIEDGTATLGPFLFWRGFLIKVGRFLFEEAASCFVHSFSAVGVGMPVVACIFPAEGGVGGWFK